jgi:tripartite-type tricarboxylate transporter receptor subunit TctC
MDVAGFTAEVLEFHRSGRIRVLAMTSPKRLATAPEIPTVTETGFPGLTITISLGLLAPPGTPPPIIEQIAEATRLALAEPAYQQSLIEGGQIPKNSASPNAADVALWARVVKSLELKLD